ncbi:hypothetical protein CKO12_00080 [Chromatium okenii]|uniref:SPOR domain-containing protein n=1 Tax=Chromatium okenii TaxID=61644 RepID=UPI0019033C53|nr:SPOR domain-containing protein [Chromatium okenii]MBK1640303.1 hypothetical protein [Chromatium okenii]
MNDSAKKRLVGLVALVALAAVFVPMLFEERAPPPVPPLANGLLEDAELNDRLTADLPAADLPTPEATETATPELNTEALPEPETPTRMASSVADDPDLNLDVGATIPDMDIAPPPGRRETTSRAETVAPMSASSAPYSAPTRSTAKPKPKPIVANVKPPTPKSKPTQAPKEPKEKETEKKSSWVIQVASLGNAETAANLQNKLKKAGFTAFVEKAEVRGKYYYRVRVGPQKNRAAAERLAARLRQQQKLDTLIHRR